MSERIGTIGTFGSKAGSSAPLNSKMSCWIPIGENGHSFGYKTIKSRICRLRRPSAVAFRKSRLCRFCRDAAYRESAKLCAPLMDGAWAVEASSGRCSCEKRHYRHYRKQRVTGPFRCCLTSALAHSWLLLRVGETRGCRLSLAVSTVSSFVPV
jgi:hypothetical protein